MALEALRLASAFEDHGATFAVADQGRIEAMARDFKDILHEATALPERDRAMLAGLLIESLDPELDADVEAAWSEEIRRRVAELDAGTVKTILWEDVRKELFDRLN